ncbi:MAG: hypothetical protein U0670_10415 [Anaerolineae bacterium]
MPHLTRVSEVYWIVPMAGLIRSHLSLLRDIANALKLPDVQAEGRTPGLIAVYRITVRYHDGRACDSAATLWHQQGDRWRLEIGYRGAFEGKLLHYPMTPARGDAFAAALASVGFDRLGDSPDVPLYPTADLWLIERAAGTFYRGVLLAPETTGEPYTRLVNAVQNGLPEAVKRVE